MGYRNLNTICAYINYTLLDSHIIESKKIKKLVSMYYREKKIQIIFY